MKIPFLRTYLLIGAIFLSTISPASAAPDKNPPPPASEPNFLLVTPEERKFLFDSLSTLTNLEAGLQKSINAAAKNAAPSGADSATQEQLKTLHELVVTQQASLDRLQRQIEQVNKQVAAEAQAPAPTVNLDPLRADFKLLKEDAMPKLGDRVVTETKTSFAAYEKQLNRLETKFDQQLKSLAEAALKNTAAGSSFGPVAAIIIVGLVIGGFQFWTYTREEERYRKLSHGLNEFHQGVSNGLKSIDQSSETVKASVEGSLKKLSEAFSENLKGQSVAITQMMQSAQLEELKGALRESSQELGRLNSRLAVNANHLQAVDSNLAQVSQQQNEDQQRLLAALLPPVFLAKENLSEWPRKMLRQVAVKNKNAAELFLKLAELQRLLNIAPPDRKEMALTLHAVGQLAYQFFQSEPNSNDDSVNDHGARWAEELNKILSSKNTGLSLSAIYKRQNFDISRMHSVRSTTGNQFGVVQPLSWIIFDVSGNSAKVLHHGMVVTE